MKNKNKIEFIMICLLPFIIVGIINVLLWYIFGDYIIRLWNALIYYLTK